MEKLVKAIRPMAGVVERKGATVFLKEKKAPFSYSTVGGKSREEQEKEHDEKQKKRRPLATLDIEKLGGKFKLTVNLNRAAGNHSEQFTDYTMPGFGTGPDVVDMDPGPGCVVDMTPQVGERNPLDDFHFTKTQFLSWHSLGEHPAKTDYSDKRPLRPISFSYEFSKDAAKNFLGKDGTAEDVAKKIEEDLNAKKLDEKSIKEAYHKLWPRLKIDLAE